MAGKQHCTLRVAAPPPRGMAGPQESSETMCEVQVAVRCMPELGAPHLQLPVRCNHAVGHVPGVHVLPKLPELDTIGAMRS
jgi:hypothetical protein